MAAKMGFLAVLLVAMVTIVSGQPDTSVCTPLTPVAKAPARPTFKPTFEVHVEANIHNKGYTIDDHLWFDNPNKRTAVHSDKNSTRTHMIYSFSTNELFVIDMTVPQGACKVSKLSDSHTLFLFGRQTPDGKGAQIYNTSEAFHFGTAYPEKWMGQTVVRGIRVNQWRSCVYWSGINSTMILDWYFSDPLWQTSTLDGAAPIRANVVGTTWTNNKPSAFNHTYDFVDYHPDLTHLTAFETPRGVYCPKRKMTKPLPTPPSAFHFTSEILLSDRKTIAYIKEYYDYDLKLVRYDRTPIEANQFGMNPQKTIHDFNTGVSYNIDDIRGNCTPGAISNDAFDVRNSDPTHVRIRSSKEFYYFDKTNYTYEGTRSVRGMLTDVWIAQRSDWPSPSAGINSTWEWYFLSPAYIANIPDTLQFGMPVRMALNAGINAVYNIYDYDEQRPDIWSFDISACFNYTEKRDFSFLLPGSFRSVASLDTEKFKYAVIRGITAAGSQRGQVLTALRITNIRIDYADNNDIIVKFTLLDKAPPIGDVKSPQVEPDLNTVASSISGAINGGTFVVKLMAGGNPFIMNAKAYSLTPTQNIVQRSYYTPPTQTVVTGTSGGIMAGMAVALLVICFIMGVAATYIFYRRRGGAFLPKKFDNTDITQDTS